MQPEFLARLLCEEHAPRTVVSVEYGLLPLLAKV